MEDADATDAAMGDVAAAIERFSFASGVPPRDVRRVMLVLLRALTDVQGVRSVLARVEPHVLDMVREAGGVMAGWERERE